MSIPVSAVYCKHWLEKTNITLSYKYPVFSVKPHMTLDLRDSIHYNALINNEFTLYNELITKTDQHEHSLLQFLILRDALTIDNTKKIKVLFCLDLNKYIIIDGLHRAAILLYKGLIKDCFPLKILDISYDIKTQNYVKQLMLSTTTYTQYNGWNNRLPYHTISLGEIKLKGQRDVEQRLFKIKSYVNFDNKTVVDFGCNIGGNLFQLPEIKIGIGFDYDKICIQSADKIKNILQYNNSLNFYVHDFDINTNEELLSKITNHPDIIFLTSMGSWVKSWKKLYTLCKNYKTTIIFETNNDTEGKPQLDFFNDCDVKMISDNSNDDCTGNHTRKMYLITPKNGLEHYKVHITAKYHHKNEFSLYKSIELLKWEITTFEDADIVFSPHTYIDISQYPNKKFIFGPHFDVFPNDIVRQFKNIHNNSIYIQPSQQSIISWVNEFKFTNIPMKVYPFGVDTQKFQPTNTFPRENVFLYYKNRDPLEYDFVCSFLNQRKIPYRIFRYSSYKEQEYLDYIKTCKYGIWLGRHESQGFALEECLSMNVPLLVWNVTLRKQEYGLREYYKNIKSQVTTIPYWSDKCGMFFYHQKDLETTFNKFIEKLPSFQPRQFILDNLSIEQRTIALKTLVDNI